tara:strand:+ start:1547 stop:1852 length:306 start_codon:yes stop_codon:yes gene_type:complete
MSFAELTELLVAAGFATFGEPVIATPRGGDPISTAAIIDRNAEVKDEYGVTVESRIEVELLSADVSGANRGTTVEADTDTFQLLSPISDNGKSTRWTATRS